MKSIAHLSLQDIAAAAVFTVDPDVPLRDAVTRLASSGVSSLVVARGGKPLGIVTERDLLGLMCRGFDGSQPVSAIMSQPVVTASADMDFTSAQLMMTHQGIRHLVLVDDAGQLMGVASESDFRRHLGLDVFESIQSLHSVMNEGVEVLPVQAALGQGLALMASKRLDYLIVGDRTVPQGILTERDVPRLMARHLDAATVTLGEVMNAPLRTIRLDVPVYEAARLMELQSVRHLVVVNDDGHLVGVVSQHHILDRLATVLLEDSHHQLGGQLALTRIENERRFRSLLENIPIALCHINASGDLLFVNPAFESLFGYTLADLPHLDTWWQRAYPDADYRRWVQATWASKLAGTPRARGVIRSLDYTVTCRDNSRRTVEISGIRLDEDLLVTFIDMTERRQEQALLEFGNGFLQRVSTGQALGEVLDFAVTHIEEQCPNTQCSLLLLDDSGQHLQHGSAPNLPADYCAAIDGVTIGPNVGSCGTAAWLGEPVFAGDIAADPRWADYKDLALAHGLAACWSSPILSSAQRVLGTFAVYWTHPQTDISERVVAFVQSATALAAIAIESAQRRNELQAQQEHLQLAAGVFTHAREGIMITDVDGHIVDVNDMFTHITGYTREEALGQSPNLLRSGRQPPEFYAAMWKALQDKGHWYGELWNRHKSGDVFMETLSINAIRNANGHITHYVSLFSDITQQLHHQQQLDHVAHHDLLTSLPNRLLLEDRLQEAMRRSALQGTSLAVAVLDLDGFKAVNDQHGHDAGDEVLTALAVQMQRGMRDSDTLARLGGDEFVAVFADLDAPAEFELLLTHLLHQAASPITVLRDTDHPLTLQLSASAGVTTYPQDPADADLLMRHADQAMYTAKLAGKNRFHLFDVARDSAIQSQHESLKRIELALERQEFVLFYQPKLNMRSGHITGAEALIRWQHPERGLLAPGTFLPTVENHPLAVAIGEWVIRSALTQMDDWRAQGVDLPVSINLDARQRQSIGFAASLGEVLAMHPAIAPEHLQLEVLETSALEDMGKVRTAMTTCQNMGLSFALDDFGTGYSSLTYLCRLPAETVKIDQSFVRDMLDDADDLAIVNGVIGLAKAFGREVIAEGVETHAQGQRLLELGCELAQGYGIARPMPAADLPGWLRHWNSHQLWQA